MAKEQQLLTMINGDAGIVSSIGQANKVNNDKGSIHTFDENLNVRNLNALAKIFHKGPNYTSIIETLNEPKLYLSCPGKIPEHGWTVEEKNAVLAALNNFIHVQDENSYKVLFQQMYTARHGIVQTILWSKVDQEKNKQVQGLDNNLKFFQALKNGKPLNITLDVVDTFQKLVVETIDTIINHSSLPDINELVTSKTIEIIPYNHNPGHGIYDQYYGVHVEVKGIHWARQSHTEATGFNIGLAINKITEQPGCCVGCSSEFTALEITKKYTLNRIADYHQNFPPKNYTASPNVNELLVLKEFTTTLLTHAKNVIQTNKLDPALMGKYQEINRCLEENFSGQGIDEYEQTSYWYKYTKQAMDYLLKLRLESSGIEKVKTINLNYVWDGYSETTEKLSKEIILNFSNRSEKILIPLNLYAKHWIGIAVDKNDHEINFCYMDSEQKEIPSLLKEQLIKHVATIYSKYKINLIEARVEVQKYNNCGPEVIENFISYLTGYRLSQDDTVLVHSALLEDTLLLGLESNDFASSII